MADDQRVPPSLAILLFTLLQAAPPLLRGEATDARLDIRVTAGGRSVVGLHASDFMVTQGERRLRVTALAAEEQPPDVPLMLDISASMQQWLQQLADYTEAAFHLLTPADRVGVAMFSDKFRVRADLSSGRNTARKAITLVTDNPSPRDIEEPGSSSTSSNPRSW